MTRAALEEALVWLQSVLDPVMIAAERRCLAALKRADPPVTAPTDRRSVVRRRPPMAEDKVYCVFNASLSLPARWPNDAKGERTVDCCPPPCATSLLAWAEPEPMFHLQLHGAGHVGQAVIAQLRFLDLVVYREDSREALLQTDAGVEDG